MAILQRATLILSIREISWRTARIDAHETYMDTAYWEQLQYIGDTRIQALISYVVSGDDRLARQALQAFDDSQYLKGLPRAVTPGALAQYIPPFSLLYVNMLHDYWMYRPDRKFVSQLLPGTRAVLEWFLKKQRPDGMSTSIPPDGFSSIGYATWRNSLRKIKKGAPQISDTADGFGAPSSCRA